MSRIGKLPIQVPAGVTITNDGKTISVTGPKGTLSQDLLDGITVAQDGNVLTVTRKNDEALYKARHGLMRSLINNLVVGVTSGFEKKLEVNGVGFRVALMGTNLKLNLGFSHDIIFAIPQGITITIEQNIITVSGINKQQVGQVASEIRAFKKPEPYKGKGIKYIDERILRKSGKSGKE
ncbi:50S ribosomal protein L6 [bacterium]|nr:50S ribosomal protein L6 [bacterium]